MLKVLQSQTFTLPDTDSLIYMEPEDQIYLISQHLTILKKLQDQLNELDGKEDKVNQKLLQGYINNTMKQVQEIYTSLDKGNDVAVDSHSIAKALEQHPIDPDQVKVSPSRAKLIEAERTWKEMQSSKQYENGIDACVDAMQRKENLENYFKKFKAKHLPEDQEVLKLENKIQTLETIQRVIEWRQSQFLSGEKAFEKLLKQKQIEEQRVLSGGERQKKDEIDHDSYAAYLKLILETDDDKASELLRQGLQS